MLPSTPFRFSTYFTLGVACLGLGYAESAMLPEAGAFAVVIAIAMAVIFRVEARVPLLSIPAANRLGAWIGFIALIWAGFRVFRELKRGEFQALGWTVFLVALTGPLLMALVCAKLLRREKHAGDYWVMHGMALAAIILAGVMAEQAVTVLATAAYLFGAVWSLSLFFLSRSSGAVAAIPGKEPPLGTVGVAGKRGWPANFLRAAIWTMVAAVIAIPIYLLTPRSPAAKFSFDNSRIEIGYAADQMIDLNRTGELRENPETAFEVRAADSRGRPKDDLDPEQKWCGAFYVGYTRGVWRRDIVVQLPTVPQTRPPTVPWAPPDFGPNGYTLTYTVPRKLRSRFLAEPVAWQQGEQASVADLPENGSPQPWHPAINGAVFTNRLGGGPRTISAGPPMAHYVQYTLPPAEIGVSQAYPMGASVRSELKDQPLDSVRVYADKVMDEMAAAGRLPAGALRREVVYNLPYPQYHEVIARAFRDHLSERTDLLYSTDIRRENEDVDPIEDFLFYSKAGHCERFATALVLMLRSEGIPAVMVLGFKGCEATGSGTYAVRQEFAHAWAQALIQRPDPRTRGPVWHWLTLDPAPARVETPKARRSAMLDWGQDAFERYLFHYTAEERDRALQAALKRLWNPQFLGVAVIAVLLGLAWRMAKRPSERIAAADSHPSAEWFQRLVDLLGQHGFTPAPGATPREFAEEAAMELGERAATAPHAAVPIEWVNAYYRSRFGGTPIAFDEQQELDAGLDALQKALERGSHP